MIQQRAKPFLFVLFLAVLQLPGQAQKRDAASAQGVALLWQDPGDISSRNLFYGRGGKEHQPQPPVKFLKEDKHGHTPKFDIEDTDGKKWRAKLGAEAQPETAAARLLWAVGYFSNEDYFVQDLEVTGLPPQIGRGGDQFVISPGHVRGARLQRHPGGQKREQKWDWKHNPFVGTREFNGLRVMMVLVSNWDLKEDNNAIFDGKGNSEEKQYEVSDLGSTFGTSGRRFTDEGSKNNLNAYRKARFISTITPDHVDFDFPRRPPFIFIPALPYYIHEIRLRWIGNHIPRADAKWIGGLLAQLSPEQIRDAFRAAGYSPEKVEGFSHVVEARIAELKRL